MPTDGKPEKTARELAELLSQQTGVPAALIDVRGTATNWTAAIVGSIGTQARQDQFATIANALATQFDLQEE